MRNQKGFTLIELMIVIAIIGILAAIAIPAYSNYVKKAKFTEVVQSTAGVKLAIDVCFQKEGSLAACDTESEIGMQVGLPEAEGGQYVNTVAITATTGVITATSQNIDSTNPDFKLTPTADTTAGTLDWDGVCSNPAFC